MLKCIIAKLSFCPTADFSYSTAVDIDAFIMTTEFGHDQFFCYNV